MNQTNSHDQTILKDNAARSRIRDHAHLIWGAAERMRGKVTPADYGKVILPFTVLRRMDCLLAPRLDEIKQLADSLKNATDEARDQIVSHALGLPFYGLSPYTLDKLDRKSTRLNSSHVAISYAVFCLKKQKNDLHMH